MFGKVDRSSSINLLSDLLAKVTDIGTRLGAGKRLPEQTLLQQCEELLSKAGEATSLAQASYILTRYQMLSAEQKREFFLDILQHFGMDDAALDKAVDAWRKNKTSSSSRALHFASEPRSQQLIRRLNQAPNATLKLVNMRADLLGFVRSHTQLKALDQDFSHLFVSWFNRGFLQLERIDWNTSAAVLEKIIAYEAVHEIHRWKDLRLRVAAPDRRLYAYFHPALGTEPLIFVEVAITAKNPDAIAPILCDERAHLIPEEATTAVFYSISNCQSGLKGISFGNFLIKQVVESLHGEFPNLKTFVTLSPVPGFRKWSLAQASNPDPLTNDQDLALITQLEEAKEDNTLLDFISGNNQLKKLVAKYLVATRSPRGGASDPVSRFHLGNGACLENIHLSADVSPNGVNNAWGCMVNYQYNIEDIEANHEAYSNGDDIIISPAVNNLLK
ncbi:MAG: malonyl-CoA decarboxylase family protein [Oceanospirillaceae bacterium]|nr:malonyl-CoA decarboxylase family protein [Oceanospirillaceae bacterium]